MFVHVTENVGLIDKRFIVRKEQTNYQHYTIFSTPQFTPACAPSLKPLIVNEKMYLLRYNPPVNCYYLPQTASLLGLLLNSENGGFMFLRKNCLFSKHHVACVQK
jgi:hypothetical protein